MRFDVSTSFYSFNRYWTISVQIPALRLSQTVTPSQTSGLARISNLCNFRLSAYIIRVWIKLEKDNYNLGAILMPTMLEGERTCEANCETRILKCTPSALFKFLNTSSIFPPKILRKWSPMYYIRESLKGFVSFSFCQMYITFVPSPSKEGNGLVGASIRNCTGLEQAQNCADNIGVKKRLEGDKQSDFVVSFLMLFLFVPIAVILHGISVQVV